MILMGPFQLKTLCDSVIQSISGTSGIASVDIRKLNIPYEVSPSYTLTLGSSLKPGGKENSFILSLLSSQVL